MKTKKMLFLSVISLLSLAGCARTAESSSEEAKSESSSEVQPTSTSSAPESTSAPESSSIPVQPSSTPAPVYDDRVSVFVLSGQSNMQGNSSSSETNLKKAFEDLGFDDYDDVASGMESVLSSVYCAGYGELNHENLVNNSRLQSYTNKENQFAGKFIPTVPGLGNFNGTSGSNMGPEFGAAYYLKDYADEDKPIFFIKMASNGSGFAQSGTQYNWPVKDDSGNFPEINLYHTFAKPFIENCLKIIEEEYEFTPVIKGWLWHQGESDCDGGVKTASYAQRLGDMVELFREDFADYALDEDGDNIAFIDGMVYQGSGTAWTKPEDMNAQKQQFANSGDNNYLVDIYANEEQIPENELKPGSPGGDSMHYNTKSQLRLGMAYGRIIEEEGLLDF